MKIRVLVKATPSGHVGDVHDAEIDITSGTAWVTNGAIGFRLNPREFELVAEPPAAAPVLDTPG